MHAAVISMDESGQTGQNLLDPNQPVFVLASVDLSDDEAAALIGSVSDEIHFSEDRHDPAGRARIVSILHALPAGRVKVVVIHKSFMTTAKMVDLLIEPALHSARIDGHADGSLLALADLWHATIPVLVDQDALPEIHRWFVRAIHKRDPAAVAAFYDTVENVKARSTIEIPAWDILAGSRSELEELLRKQALPVLEPGVPAAQALVYQWALEYESGFEVRHDARHGMTPWIRELKRHYGVDESVESFSLRDGVTIRLPVPVTLFDLADSRNHPALQVADVVASATAVVLGQRVLAARAPHSFASELADAPLLSFLADGNVWPDPDRITDPPPSSVPGEFDRLVDWVGRRRTE